MKCMMTIVLLLLLPIITDTAVITDQYREERFNRAVIQMMALDIKQSITSVLKDVRSLDLENVEPLHLIWMEEQRVKYDIPVHIYYRLVFRESTYRENAVSWVGARGYMQVMPRTFRWIRENEELGELDIGCPFDNIAAGSWYLRYLKDKVDKRYPVEPEIYRWKRTLASYNAGYSVHRVAMYGYRETRDYLEFVLRDFGIGVKPTV